MKGEKKYYLIILEELIVDGQKRETFEVQRQEISKEVADCWIKAEKESKRRVRID